MVQQAPRMGEGASLEELLSGRAEGFTIKPKLKQAMLQFIDKYTSTLFLKNKSDTDVQ